jgi:periplasmic protein TonB
VKDAIHDVLVLRAPDPAGLGRFLTWSIGVHLALLVGFAAGHLWLFRSPPKPHVMTISLGGTPGPRSSGMSPIGARPVEQQAPPPTRPEPIRPAAPRHDVMTVAEKPRPKSDVKPVETPLPPERVAHQPTTGAKVMPGTARAETGATGLGTGLSQGGGGGASVTGIPADFCCPDYVDTIQSLISSNWHSTQPERGTTVVRFTILRDGTVADIQIEQTSGSGLLDRASTSALRDNSFRLPPLPAAYPASKLTIHLTFVYQGR